jgi:hypothetical protein
VGTEVEDSAAVLPRRLRIEDLCAVFWIVAVAVGLVLPALAHGHFIGSFDVQYRSGLNARPGAILHNFTTSDQEGELIPWTNLTWQQVHAGHLPLWNSYSGTGLPLAFNWQSAPLAVPTLMGYLVPLRYAYDTAILTTLVVAGTGAFVLSRVLHLGTLPAIFGATVFELSGPLTGWLGYPHAGVMSWGGWLVAATIVVIRGKRGTAGITFLALVVAATLYSGQPEVAAVMIGATTVFGAVLLAHRLPWFQTAGPLKRPAMDFILGGAAGGLLAAPFVLPGLQVIALSKRNMPTATSPMAVHSLMYLVTQGFDGLPIAGQLTFSKDSYFFPETVGYVGLVAVVLAAIALVTQIRRPEVVAFLVVGVGGILILFTDFARKAIFHVPGLNTIGLTRLLMPVALALAVTAGIGLDHVLRLENRRRAAKLLARGFGFTGLGLAVVFTLSVPHLSRFFANERRHSFLWPTIGVVAGLAAAGVLTYTARSGNDRKMTNGRRARIVAGSILLGAETGFLVASGAPILSSSNQGFTTSGPVTKLQYAVGESRIGYSGGTCAAVGLPPEINIAYGISQLDAYDPIIPSSVYDSWKVNAGTFGGIPAFNLFCPRVTSASIARLYGLSYLIQPANENAPKGTVPAGRVGNELLVRVPGASIATLTPVGPHAPWPPNTAPGTPVAVLQPNPAKWDLHISAPTASVLRLRLTNVPGWTATLDGRPLALSTFAGSMLQARVPPGVHQIALRYWPKALTLGIVLAVLTSSILLVALAVSRRRSTGSSIRENLTG